MRRPRGVILFPLLLLTGCPTKAKLPSDGGTDDGPTAGSTGSAGSAGSAGSKDASADSASDGSTADASDAPQPIPTLQITAPATGSYASGTVTITVVASGGPAPATISLFLDDATTPVASPAAPSPYSSSWNTTNVPEGPHNLVAKAVAGGQPIASAPVVVNIDHTAPKVMMRTPAIGATDVVLRSLINLTFSEAIAASTLTPSAVALTVGGSPVATTVTLSVDGKVANIAIDDLSAFALPATFAVTLAPTITDLAGNALVVPTTPWSWTVPDWIKLPQSFQGDTSLSPHLAVGPTFLPALSYIAQAGVQGGGSGYLSEVTLYDGAAWDRSIPPPSTDPSSGFFGNSIDVDARDNVLLAWAESTSSSTQIHLGWWNGSAWDLSIPPIDALGIYVDSSNSPLVRADSDGRPVVTWIEPTSTDLDGPGHDGFVARWDGTQWDSFGELGLSNLVGSDLTLDGQLNPIIGWTDGTGNGGIATWGATGWTQSPPLSGVNDPTVGFDSTLGALMIAQTTGFKLFHVANNVWQAALAAPIPTTAMAKDFTFRVALNHEVVVAWVDTTGPNKLGLARWNGTTWSARAGLFYAGADALDELPELVVDSQGTAWLAWVDLNQVNVWMSNY